MGILSVHSARALRMNPFGVAVRPRCLWGSPDHVDALGGEDGVEGSGELRVPVPDQEPEGRGPIAEIDQDVACLLRRPGGGGVGGDAEDVHPAGGDLHLTSTFSRRRVMVPRWKKSVASNPDACVRRKA